MVIDLTKNKRFHLTNTQSIFLPDFPWPESLRRNLLAFQGLRRVSVHLSVCLWIGLCSTSSCCSNHLECCLGIWRSTTLGGGKMSSCFCWFLSTKPYSCIMKDGAMLVFELNWSSLWRDPWKWGDSWMFLFIRFSGPKVHRSMARSRCSQGLVLHVFALPKTQQIDQVIANKWLAINKLIIFKTCGIFRIKHENWTGLSQSTISWPNDYMALFSGVDSRVFTQWRALWAAAV